MAMKRLLGTMPYTFQTSYNVFMGTACQKNDNFESSYHVDAHYASALFHFLKEFAIVYSEYATFVSMDDKHTIKVGEPGYPVAGVERGKQV